MIKNKIMEWAKRYGPPEILGIILAVTLASVVKTFTGNIVAGGIAGTWGDNLGFYVYMLIKETHHRIKKDAKNKVIGFRSVAKIGRNLIIEFGPAEYLDSFLLRPIYLSVVPLFIPNYALAIIVGTLLADITFYVPVVISYELKKKYLKD